MGMSSNSILILGILVSFSALATCLGESDLKQRNDMTLEPLERPSHKISSEFHLFDLDAVGIGLQDHEYSLLNSINFTIEVSNSPYDENAQKGKFVFQLSKIVINQIGISNNPQFLFVFTKDNKSDLGIISEFLTDGINTHWKFSCLAGSSGGWENDQILRSRGSDFHGYNIDFLNLRVNITGANDPGWYWVYYSYEFWGKKVGEGSSGQSISSTEFAVSHSENNQTSIPEITLPSAYGFEILIVFTCLGLLAHSRQGRINK